MSRHSVVRSPALWILVTGIFGVLLALALPAWAQESAAPPAATPAFTAWLLSPLGRVLCAAVVMAALEALKQWRAFADAALTHPLARLGMAAVLALVSAVPVWATGATITEALTLALSSWLGSMGLNAGIGALKGQKAAKSEASS